MRHLFGIIPVVLFLALATSYCIRSGVQPDDAGYVALRVAENLRLGQGLVFNPTEKRDLVDSPLWLGILSLVSFSSLAPLLIQLLGMALGVVVVLSVLSGPRLPVAGSCACLFLGLDGLFAARAASGGSEVLAALYLLGLYFVLRSGRGRTGETYSADRSLAVWTAIAGLVRYELVLVAVFAAFGWAWTDRRRARAWLVPAAALAGAVFCLGLRWTYFHDVPAYWQPWPPSLAGVRTGARTLLDLVLRRPLLLFATLVLVFSWLHGPLRVGRACGLTWGLFALAAFSLLPAAGGDVARHAAAALPLAYLLAVEAVWRGTRTRLGLVAALLLVVAQPAWTWMGRAPESEAGATYARLGQWLRVHAMPGTVVGARYPGALGYYSRLQVEDVLGRVSPRVAAARRTLPPQSFATAAADFDPMLRQEPDLVLVGEDERVPSAMLYVPNLDAVPEPIRGDLGVYRWAGSPVWRPQPDGTLRTYESTSLLQIKNRDARPAKAVAHAATAAREDGSPTLPNAPALRPSIEPGSTNAVGAPLPRGAGAAQGRGASTQSGPGQAQPSE